MDETERKIRGFALRNAAEHSGKTRDKTVLSKVLGACPELRQKVKEVSAQIAGIVEQVNAMDQEAQRAELERDYPEERKKEPEPRHPLPELEGAEHGRVVTRFPPEPNGYPHIGHAKAAMINSEYADMYGGKKILRMDDTNPGAERMEFYAAIKVGLDWLGIKYDEVKNTSDDIELLYEKGIQLVRSGHAYVCTCSREDVSKNRAESTECRCRAAGADESLERWHRMFEKYSPGQAVARFRGDMKAENTVMRDPVLFRIIEGKHPLVGGKYRVWPSYDLAVAVEDSVDGVTHAFRSKEYELRNELYGAILDALGMRKPRVLEFSRLALEGMPVSKRVLRPLIDEGKVGWYDDPRLPTLEGLRRRGITAEAVKKFVLSLGFTKSDTTAPFESLEAFNRKIIDAASIRLNMVVSPAALEVAGLPDQVDLPNHPSSDMGTRTVRTGGAVCVPAKDMPEEGGTIRLIGLGNVKITGHGRAEYVDDRADAGWPKVQWIPRETSRLVRIIVPGPLFVGDKYNERSLEEVEAHVEPYYDRLEDGQMIQFVRFGYCRKDSQKQAMFAHR